MDYTYIIKRNLITLMDKYRDIKPALSVDYKYALLQLPNHPILSAYDVEHIVMNDSIRRQVNNLIVRIQSGFRRGSRPYELRLKENHYIRKPTET